MIQGAILLAIGVLAVCVFILMRKGFTRPGPGAATVLGATDHLMNQDKKRSAEVIVREQSGETLGTLTSDANRDPERNST